MVDFWRENWPEVEFYTSFLRRRWRFLDGRGAKYGSSKGFLDVIYGEMQASGLKLCLLTPFYEWERADPTDPSCNKLLFFFFFAVTSVTKREKLNPSSSQDRKMHTRTKKRSESSILLARSQIRGEGIEFFLPMTKKKEGNFPRYFRFRRGQRTLPSGKSKSALVADGWIHFFFILLAKVLSEKG